MSFVYIYIYIFLRTCRVFVYMNSLFPRISEVSRRRGRPDKQSGGITPIPIRQSTTTTRHVVSFVSDELQANPTLEFRDFRHSFAAATTVSTGAALYCWDRTSWLREKKIPGSINTAERWQTRNAATHNARVHTAAAAVVRIFCRQYIFCQRVQEYTIDFSRAYVWI